MGGSLFLVSLEIKAMHIENNLMNHLERISTFGSTRAVFLLTLVLPDMEGMGTLRYLCFLRKQLFLPLAFILSCMILPFCYLKE